MTRFYRLLLGDAGEDEGPLPPPEACGRPSSGFATSLRAELGASLEGARGPTRGGADRLARRRPRGRSGSRSAIRGLAPSADALTTGRRSSASECDPSVQGAERRRSRAEGDRRSVAKIAAASKKIHPPAGQRQPRRARRFSRTGSRSGIAKVVRHRRPGLWCRLPFTTPISLLMCLPSWLRHEKACAPYCFQSYLGGPLLLPRLVRQCSREALMLDQPEWPSHRILTWGFNRREPAAQAGRPSPSSRAGNRGGPRAS